MTRDNIQKIYLALLGRPADPLGLAYWAEEIDTGVLTLEQLRANIVNEQQEFTKGLGQLSRRDFVDQLYANMFGRAPDPDSEYWVSGGGLSVNLDQLVLAFIDGASAEDTAALNNRVAVAQQITNALLALETDASALLDGVTSNPDTVTSAEQLLEQLINVQSDEDSGGTDGETGSGGTFTVTETSGVITFGGTATGPVTLSSDGINFTFTRGGVEALTQPAITSLSSGGIPSVSVNATTHGLPGVAVKLSGVVTLTDAFTGLAGANTTAYNLAAGTNSLQLTATGQNVNGNSGNDTVHTGGVSPVGTLALGEGANVVSVANGDNIRQLTITATGGTYGLDLNGTGTLTVAQYQTASSITGNGNADTIIFVDAFTGTADADIETYTLANGTNSITLAASGQSVNGGIGADTVITGGSNPAGVLALGGGANTLILTNGDDISAATITATGSYNLVWNGSATLTVAQYTGAAAITASGSSDIVTFTDAFVATANPVIETYRLADASNNITLANASQNVFGGNGADTVNTAGLTPNGTLALGGGANTVIIASGDDISAANISSIAGTHDLVINGSATLTSAQHLNAINIIASGNSDTIILSDAFSGTADADVETYTLANATNNLILSAVGQNVNGGSGVDTVYLGSLAASGNLALGAGLDRLSAADGANLSALNNGLATSAESLIVADAGRVTLTAQQLSAFTQEISGNGITLRLTDTLNATQLDAIRFPSAATLELANTSNSLTTQDSLLASSHTLTVDASNLSSVNSLTFNGTEESDGMFILTGGAAADNITGGQGNDRLHGAAGTDTLIGGTGADTLIGGAGADILDVTAEPAVIDTVVIAAGDTALTIGGSGDAGMITGFDRVAGFTTGDGTHSSDALDVHGTATRAADGSVDGTDSSLTVAGATIKSHRVAAGMVEFDDADTFSTALTINTDVSVAAVVQYLQNNDLGNAGVTLAFRAGTDTYVYTQGSDNGINNSLDTLVRLTGVQADALVTTNGAGLNDLYIL